MESSNQTLWLVYDGYCPLCSAFAKRASIRKAVGELQIINAREEHPLINEITQQGISLDEGLVVKYNDNLYHGADAMHMLAMLSTDSDWLNKTSNLIFSSKSLTKILYPFLRCGRNALLWYNGRSQINNLKR